MSRPLLRTEQDLDEAQRTLLAWSGTTLTADEKLERVKAHMVLLAESLRVAIRNADSLLDIQLTTGDTMQHMLDCMRRVLARLDEKRPELAAADLHETLNSILGPSPEGGTP